MEAIFQGTSVLESSDTGGAPDRLLRWMAILGRLGQSKDWPYGNDKYTAAIATAVSNVKEEKKRKEEAEAARKKAMEEADEVEMDSLEERFEIDAAYGVYLGSFHVLY